MCAESDVAPNGCTKCARVLPKCVETDKTTVTADSCYTSVHGRIRLSKNAKATLYCVVYIRLGGLQGLNFTLLKGEELCYKPLRKFWTI